MDSAKSQCSRRQFVKTAAAAGLAVASPLVVSGRALGLDGSVAPSKQLTLGVIGIGPRATYDLGGILKQPDCHCVAVCDVWKKRRDAGKLLIDKRYDNTDCKTYRDFRDVLARKDIDTVLIGTGDRWHVPISILAAKAGKDIYSEKPCGLAIGDCQKLDEVIQQTGRVFQAGTQRRNVVNFRAVVEYVRSGKLGKLQKMVASVYQPLIKSEWLPGEPTPARDELDWDLWLGPAPWRLYNHAYVEHRGWQGHWDFTGGANLLDWGAHTVDLCQWANKADDTYPIEYEMAGKNIECRYANGVTLTLDSLESPFGKRPGWTQSTGTCPVRFIGEGGWIETGDTGKIEASSEAIKNDLKAAVHKRQVGLDVSTHARNFFDCVKSREKPVANSHVVRHSHVACFAAATAWILKRKMTLDPAKEAFVNDDEANGLRYRAARAAWAV